MSPRLVCRGHGLLLFHLKADGTKMDAVEFSAIHTIMAAGTTAIQVGPASRAEIHIVPKIAGSIGEDPPVELRQSLPVYFRVRQGPNDTRPAGMAGVTGVFGPLRKIRSVLLSSDLHKPDTARGTMDADAGRHLMQRIA